MSTSSLCPDNKNTEAALMNQPRGQLDNSLFCNSLARLVFSNVGLLISLAHIAFSNVGFYSFPLHALSFPMQS